MKKATGTLLRGAGRIINICTLLVLVVYLFGTVVWMHAPLFGVLASTAPVALLPLGLAWLCRRIGRHLCDDGPMMTASPRKRWLLALIGLVTLGAFATLARTGHQAYACHANRASHAEGFERVCPGDLARWDVGFLPNFIATRNLAFTPVDLTRTPFAQLESLGARAETAVGVRSRLYRGFQLPDGHRLTLYEEDMSSNGITTSRRPEDEPERINGLPARLVVMQAPSGKAVSLLSWVEGRRDYQLWIDANVVRVPLRAQLFALAASLPRSVPACPDEVLPKKTRRGPDGMPLDDPVPEITPLNVNAGANQRPCK